MACVSTFHVLCQLLWLTVCLLFSINNLIHLTVTICILLAYCICVDMNELSEISYTVYEEDLMLSERL